MTLLELNRQISETVHQAFPSNVWIQAEIAEMNINANTGHCYLDLIEKHEKKGIIMARARAMIWNNRWWYIKETFELASGQVLCKGLKVLIEVQVVFHENFGYSLIINDIDPTFTLGEMERNRREIIDRLTQEGIIDLNSSLIMPAIPQRIAIVSTGTAAGYGDFCHQLENNEWNIKFYTHLFQASMQGRQTEQSVILALDNIYKCHDLFDVVVIIRGGGATADLNSFDNYNLAVNVANFPIPVITGIGHERDKTVLDAVAHTSVKTPTAAAAFLINLMAIQVGNISQIQQQIEKAGKSRIEQEFNHLIHITNHVRTTHASMQQQIGAVNLTLERVKMLCQQRIQNETNKLHYFEKTIQVVQPDIILKRGFSIARVNGKAIHSAKDVSKGQNIEIQTADGTFTTHYT